MGHFACLMRGAFAFQLGGRLSDGGLEASRLEAEIEVVGMAVPGKLRVEYQSEDAFAHEYDRNISKGGIFIATPAELEIREAVEVELVMVQTGASVLLDGEVVHRVSPELAANGAGQPGGAGQAGVAVQFLLESDALRAALAPFSPAIDAPIRERKEELGRREAPRSGARVIARIEIDGEWVNGRTRNVSTQGVLVAVPNGPLAIGSEVRIRITHPTDGTQMKIRGVVARHAQGDGETCMGIRFRVPEEHRERVAKFMNRVRAADHNRRLGAITGPLAQLGPKGVLRMFATSAPEGTLTLSQGVGPFVEKGVDEGFDEGVVTIERGRLRATLRELSGKPALDVMLAWTEGSFEFEARAEQGLVDGPEMSLEEALGETELQLEEELQREKELQCEDEVHSEEELQGETELPLEPECEAESACDTELGREDEALLEEILLEEDAAETALLELGEFNFDDASSADGIDLESADEGFSPEALSEDTAAISADCSTNATSDSTDLLDAPNSTELLDRPQLD